MLYTSSMRFLGLVFVTYWLVVGLALASVPNFNAPTVVNLPELGRHFSTSILPTSPVPCGNGGVCFLTEEVEYYATFTASGRSHRLFYHDGSEEGSAVFLGLLPVGIFPEWTATTTLTTMDNGNRVLYFKLTENHVDLNVFTVATKELSTLTTVPFNFSSTTDPFLRFHLDNHALYFAMPSSSTPAQLYWTDGYTVKPVTLFGTNLTVTSSAYMLLCKEGTVLLNGTTLYAVNGPNATVVSSNTSYDQILRVPSAAPYYLCANNSIFLSAMQASSTVEVFYDQVEFTNNTRQTIYSYTLAQNATDPWGLVDNRFWLFNISSLTLASVSLTNPSDVLYYDYQQPSGPNPQAWITPSGLYINPNQTGWQTYYCNVNDPSDEAFSCSLMYSGQSGLFPFHASLSNRRFATYLILPKSFDFETFVTGETDRQVSVVMVDGPATDQLGKIWISSVVDRAPLSSLASSDGNSLYFIEQAPTMTHPLPSGKFCQLITLITVNFADYDDIGLNRLNSGRFGNCWASPNDNGELMSGFYDRQPVSQMRAYTGHRSQYFTYDAYGELFELGNFTGEIEGEKGAQLGSTFVLGANLPDEDDFRVLAVLEHNKTPFSLDSDKADISVIQGCGNWLLATTKSNPLSTSKLEVVRYYPDDESDQYWYIDEVDIPTSLRQYIIDLKFLWGFDSIHCINDTHAFILANSEFFGNEPITFFLKVSDSDHTIVTERLNQTGPIFIDHKGQLLVADSETEANYIYNSTNEIDFFDPLPNSIDPIQRLFILNDTHSLLETTSTWMLWDGAAAAGLPNTMPRCAGYDRSILINSNPIELLCQNESSLNYINTAGYRTVIADSSGFSFTAKLPTGVVAARWNGTNYFIDGTKVLKASYVDSGIKYANTMPTYMPSRSTILLPGPVSLDAFLGFIETPTPCARDSSCPVPQNAPRGYCAYCNTTVHYCMTAATCPPPTPAPVRQNSPRAISSPESPITAESTAVPADIVPWVIVAVLAIILIILIIIIVLRKKKLQQAH